MEAGLSNMDARDSIAQDVESIAGGDGNRIDERELGGRSLDDLKAGMEIGPANRRFSLVRLVERDDITRLWLAQDLSSENPSEEQRLRALRIFSTQPVDSSRAPENQPKEEGKASRLDLINLRSYLVKMRVRVELAAHLKHPNINRIYGWRQGDDGWLFVEMEFADQRSGSTLDRLLRSEAEAGLGLQRCLQLLYPVAEALDYAHREHRLAHRTLRAENVFVTALGTVKLLNFGLEEYETRETRESVQESPQLAQDARVESQTTDQARFKQDVSALAALLYQLLTGVTPFTKQSPAVWHGTKSLPKPTELGDADWKTLQLSLDPRNQECPISAVELLRRLGAVRSIPAKPGGQRTGNWRRASVLLALGILIGGGVVWSIGQKFLASTAQFQQRPTPGLDNANTDAIRQTDQKPTGYSKLESDLSGAGEANPEELMQIKREMDDGAYAAAQRIGTPTAYRIYLQRCPECFHEESASAAIKELETKGKIAKLKAQFESQLSARDLSEKGQNGNDPLAVLAEIEKLMPRDPFIVQGRKRVTQDYIEYVRESAAKGMIADARHWLAKAKAAQASEQTLSELSAQIDRAEHKVQDDAAYAQAERSNTQKAYQSYLDSCTPPCAYRREAQMAMERLKTSPPSATNTVFRDKLIDGSLGPEMVVVPAGVFTMGSPPGERGRYSDEQAHSAQIASSFAIGKHEVTFEEYDRFAERTGRAKPDDKGWGRGRHPVINVDWNDATAYAEWLSSQTGHRYRLPTEAEWEYAARAGSQTARFWGDDPNQGCSYANGADLIGKSVFTGWTIMNCRDGYVFSAPVGNYKPNPFGLHDMLGNVLEWTCSAYNESYDGNELHCATRERVLHFVYRGGSWSDEPRGLRAADRHKGVPEFRDYFLGLRVVRQL